MILTDQSGSGCPRFSGGSRPRQPVGEWPAEGAKRVISCRWARLFPSQQPPLDTPEDPPRVREPRAYSREGLWFRSSNRACPRDAVRCSSPVYAMCEAPHGSDFHQAQSQRIADHADRRERHRGGGDNRRQQQAENRIERASRDRNPGDIICEGEEEILANIPHRGMAEMPRPDDSDQATKASAPRRS